MEQTIIYRHTRGERLNSNNTYETKLQSQMAVRNPIVERRRNKRTNGIHSARIKAYSTTLPLHESKARNLRKDRNLYFNKHSRISVRFTTRE